MWKMGLGIMRKSSDTTHDMDHVKRLVSRAKKLIKAKKLEKSKKMF